MDTLGPKSVTERLITNITSLGDMGGTKQSSMQYNIWKQSIQQREHDEMFFTVINNCILLFYACVINLMHNESYTLQLETFGSTFYSQKGIFLASSSEIVTGYCKAEIKSMIEEE